METIYHWVGFAVVWVFIAIGWAAVIYWLWEHRPKNAFTRKLGNAWAWVTIFVFGRRWLLRLEGARLLLTAYNRQRPRTLARWERDTIAFMVRYSHKKGWRAPY